MIELKFREKFSFWSLGGNKFAVEVENDVGKHFPNSRGKITIDDVHFDVLVMEHTDAISITGNTIGSNIIVLDFGETGISISDLSKEKVLFHTEIGKDE